MVVSRSAVCWINERPKEESPWLQLVSQGVSGTSLVSALDDEDDLELSVPIAGDLYEKF